jgi:murein L,D-transpeptidase YcbB/YkuD
VALIGLETAPAAKPLDGAFVNADAPALVAICDADLRPKPAEADALDLAWATLEAGRRELALALADWAAAPELARDYERRSVRAAIAAAYRARGYELFWADANGWRAAAAPALARLRQAGEDGLDLRGYDIPSADLESPGVAQELALSEAVVAYARQARGARVDPERISPLIGARVSVPEAGAALAEVAAAGAQAGERLQSFNPPHYGYQQLRDKLIELRAQRAAAPASEGLLAEAVEGAPLSDAPPPEAKAKRRHAAKLAKASTSRVEAEIIANMERWRWLPRDLGDPRIEVNIPEFELALVRNGEVAHRTRVIVGKETTPTPMFSDEMEEIIVNPSWYVPQSIIQKEWGGGVGSGYQVSYRRGRMVVRQPPGPGNALGRIKFNFPNDYAVYMHDTPSRGLFGASHRAFSHGCMRVQEPFALAGAVLGPDSGWTETRLKQLIGPTERYINLSKPLPVHIQYFTIYVDEAGRLVQRSDLYGYSARVRRALGLEG